MSWFRQAISMDDVWRVALLLGWIGTAAIDG